MSPYALWNQTGVTIAGWANGTNGSSSSQLSHPLGLSISNEDVVYAGDTYNHRIVVIYSNSSTDSFMIGSGPGSNSTRFNQPHELFITNTSLFVADTVNYRIQKMSLDGSNPTTVLDFNQSFWVIYFYIDNDANIYVSDTNNHSVWRFPFNSSNGQVVAGGGGEGSNNNQLHEPYGVFVNHHGTIYIADRKNHRIMKWVSGASEGVRVAGNGIPGSSSAELNQPIHIIVDTNDYMYISDGGNNRIIRWAPNSTFGVCIAACSGTSEPTPFHLNGPHTLAFDNNGSLYISEWANHRVQKFQIFSHFSK